MPRFNKSRFFSALLFVVLTCASFTPLALIHAQTDLGTGGGATGLGTGGGATDLGTTGCSGGGLSNPLSSCTIQDLLGKVLDAAIAIGTVVVTIMLVYCGFLFVVAQGNEEKIRDARSALVWTVIGALILLGAKVISSVIANTAGSL
jgi:hypothetical protein